MAMPKNSIHFIAVNQADSPSESNNQEVKSHDSKGGETMRVKVRSV